MIVGLEPWPLAAIAVAVLVGATVQGAVGLGLGLVAAPVTALVQPELVPGLLLWLAAAYPLLTLWRDWRSIDWRGLAWLLPARVPGTAVGVVVVALASDRVLGAAVAVMVLLAVALTARTVTVPVNPASLVGAGFIGGVTGTATSIGGPPMALLYQHRAGAEVRATLAVFFVLGALLSLLGLAIGDALSVREAQAALLLSPALLLGFAVSEPVRRHVDAGRTRTAVLVVCAASALLLLVRSAFG